MLQSANMRTAGIVLAVSLAVGLISWFVRPAEVVEPFTYDVPVRIVAQDAHQVVTSTKRCNNTGDTLTVSITAMWESNDHKSFVPLQPQGAASLDVPPGCVDRGGTPINIDYLPSGTWRLRGSVCAADRCTGWFTDWIERQ